MSKVHIKVVYSLDVQILKKYTGKSKSAGWEMYLSRKNKKQPLNQISITG